ncbi:MAG: DUF3833 domain-containing protein [Gammaproteobacteria bacterium]|nr:DUF3833 domain-containing protein [Gammaproteobacteria bacterium]MCY4358089.1 DUF3833 domain-containing protein [Gammaproteobacteria bacterium]
MRVSNQNSYKYFFRAFLFPALISLGSCSGISVEDYSALQPNLVMEEFFDGDLVAYGVVKDWRGRVIRRFSADIIAYWDNGTGTLEEDFLFDDGEQQRRVWKLQTNNSQSYTGTAGDVVGSGEVRIAGNSAFLDYILRIPYGDDTIDVRIDDRMYLVTPEVIINESSLRKFGFKVGELVLVIQQV